MASCKATDAVYKVDPPPAAKKLRELFYCAHMIHSHIAHFYALAAPDFVLGPMSDPAQRNILGVVAKVGLQIGGEVIKHRAYAQSIQAVIGGKATHPVCGLPGGMSKAITEEERKDFEEKAKSLVEFAKFSLKLFNDIVLSNKEYLDIITGNIYTMKSYYMGLVDANNKVNFYDGDMRLVDPDGKEVAKFKPAEYLDYIAEHTEPWSYMKFPFLKKVGWKGFTEGKDSGIYRVSPLARLNAADGCVIAKTFARIFFRNAIDIGLPLLECEEAVDNTEAGDILEVELSTGKIKNVTRNKEFTAKPYPEFMSQLIAAGGLIEYTKKRLGVG